MTNHDVAAAINEFAVAYDDLPVISEPPRTTLDILRIRTGEKYWNRLLRYFLNPTAPHGLKTDFLHAFLANIQAEIETSQLTNTDLREARIASEIQSDEGRPDLLIWLQDEWFICLEIKVTASETGTQTREYASSTTLGPITVPEYTTEARHYVYLTKQTHCPPSSDLFTHVYWSDIQKLIGELLQNSHGRYPTRTTAQLTEFRDTIHDETMTRTPYDTQQAQHINLYLEHSDAIDTVREAFEDMVEQQIGEWATRFVEDYRPETWDGTWKAASGKYGKLYKTSWRRNEHGEPVESWRDAAYRLEFRHQIRKHQSWKTGTVTFRTRIPKNADDEYRSHMQKVFNNNLDAFDDICNERTITIKGNRRVLTEKTYSFDQQNGPDAYYEALRTAFDDHHPLSEPLTRLFEDVCQQIVD